MIEIVTNFVYRALIAFITLLIFLIVGKFLGVLVARTLYEIGVDELTESIGIKFFFSKAAGTLVSFVFYIWGTIVALSQLGLTTIITAILFIIIALLVFFSTLLGTKDLVLNFFAGIGLRKGYLKQDYLSVGKTRGKIISVGRTRLKIRTQENEVLMVPFMALASRTKQR